MATKPKRGRSTLPKSEARRRYIEMGELVVLEQIRKKDAKKLDDGAVAVGPFARLDAEDVAARDGKTRGAITNLFGSQAAFQAETMALALDPGTWVDRVPISSARRLRHSGSMVRRVPGRPGGARPGAWRQAGGQ